MTLPAWIAQGVRRRSFCLKGILSLDLLQLLFKLERSGNPDYLSSGPKVGENICLKALVLFLLTKQKKEEKWILCPFVSAKGRSAGWQSTDKSVLPGDKPTIQIENETSRLLNQIASINNSIWRKKWVPNPENRKKQGS